MATSLEKLQELTCNKLDKYIVLESGTIVYNGFVFRDKEELATSPAGPRMSRFG